MRSRGLFAVVALVVLAAATGCDGNGDSGIIPVCGNGAWEEGEACDGTDLAGATCESWGFHMGGTLRCGPGCEFDFTECCGDGITAGDEVCDDGNEEDWDGCTHCRISEIRANTQDIDYWGWGGKLSVSINSDGSFVVVWVNMRPHGIFGQRVDSSGIRVGPEFQVNSYTSEDQDRPRVASFSDGSFVVVWQGPGLVASPFGVFGRVFDADGNAAGPEFEVNTYPQMDELNPAVATTDGGFVVVWQGEDQQGSGRRIFGRMYDLGQNPVGSEFEVNASTARPKAKPAISAIADGRFVVVWEALDPVPSNRGIFGQRFDSGGTADGTEFRVNTDTADHQIDPSVAMAPDGSFVVVWIRTDSPSPFGMGSGPFGRRFDPAGNPGGPEFFVPNTTGLYGNTHASVSTASDGRFVVAWNNQDFPHENTGVFYRRYDAGGSVLGSELRMDTQFELYSDDYHAAKPSVSMAPDGRFVAAWVKGIGSGLQVFFQRFSSSGQPLGAHPF